MDSILLLTFLFINWQTVYALLFRCSLLIASLVPVLLSSNVSVEILKENQDTKSDLI